MRASGPRPSPRTENKSPRTSERRRPATIFQAQFKRAPALKRAVPGSCKRRGPEYPAVVIPISTRRHAHAGPQPALHRVNPGQAVGVLVGQRQALAILYTLLTATRQPGRRPPAEQCFEAVCCVRRLTLQSARFGLIFSVTFPIYSNASFGENNCMNGPARTSR